MLDEIHYSLFSLNLIHSNFWLSIFYVSANTRERNKRWDSRMRFALSSYWGIRCKGTGVFCYLHKTGLRRNHWAFSFVFLNKRGNNSPSCCHVLHTKIRKRKMKEVKQTKRRPISMECVKSIFSFIPWHWMRSFRFLFFELITCLANTASRSFRYESSRDTTTFQRPMQIFSAALLLCQLKKMFVGEHHTNCFLCSHNLTRTIRQLRLFRTFITKTPLETFDEGNLLLSIPNRPNHAQLLFHDSSYANSQRSHLFRPSPLRFEQSSLPE